MNDIERKINAMTELTPSEKDRLIFKEQVNDTLLNFLQAFVTQSIAKSDLEELLDNDLLDTLQNPTEENSLTNFEKIRLKEIISKEKTDSKVSLIKALIESNKVAENKNQNTNPSNSEHNQKSVGENTTQEDIDKAKEILSKFDKLMKHIEKQEFSEEEKKNT
jgi:hypothetical protein